MLRHPGNKIPDLASTRFRIQSGLKNIHTGERIQKVPDSPFDGYVWICVDGRRTRNQKVADSKIPRYVWTGLKTHAGTRTLSWSGLRHNLFASTVRTEYFH